jgi:hypothetical protein
LKKILIGGFSVISPLPPHPYPTLGELKKKETMYFSMEMGE